MTRSYDMDDNEGRAERAIRIAVALEEENAALEEENAQLFSALTDACGFLHSLDPMHRRVLHRCAELGVVVT